MIPQNHNDATVTPEELSEYAQLRLKRMKEIEDFMNKLGLGNGPVIANLASTNQASACAASAVTKKVQKRTAGGGPCDTGVTATKKARNASKNGKASAKGRASAKQAVSAEEEEDTNDEETDQDSDESGEEDCNDGCSAGASMTTADVSSAAKRRASRRTLANEVVQEEEESTVPNKRQRRRAGGAGDKRPAEKGTNVRSARRSRRK